MSVSLIFKIAAVGILVSVLSQVLKHSGREEQAFLTSLAGLILVLIWIVPYIYDLLKRCGICFPCDGRKEEPMTMMQAAAAAVCAALLAMQFKGQKGEYGIYISIAAGMVICFGILSKLSSILDTIREIGSMIRIEGSYLAILLKMLGITYAAEFASNICRDCGNQTLAVQIELFGKLAVLVLSMPILLALLKTVQAFLT